MADPVVQSKLQEDERYYLASQWQMMRRKFGKHKAAVAGVIVLGAIYFVALFAGFFAPYGAFNRFPDFRFAPPQRLRIVHEGKLHRPFVYGYIPSRNPETLRLIYELDPSQKFELSLFVRGNPYRLLGLIPTRIHLFGTTDPNGYVFLFGTEELGRDLFSRVITASRISLSIGLVGVTLSFVLGCLFGALSGYYGGSVDLVVQRLIEFLTSIPTIPLWMALSAALPITWPPIAVYFGITIILSVIGWSGLARVVRGKFLELREADFVMAARIAGANEGRIITRHLIPSFMSYLIVHLTLAIPGMILGETALSFLGLGLRPPVVSWGVLLSTAQNVRTVALNPWLLLPGIPVVAVVLLFNFVGDGLRDAADPYH